MDTYYDEMQSIANSKGADETVDQLKQRILREAPQMGPQPEQALRLLLPENCIVPPEQRAARALLSQQMRDKQAGILANAAGIEQGRLLDNFARVSDAVKSYYLHLGQPDKVTQKFNTLEGFEQSVIDYIDRGLPIMVDWVDWAGHWQTIIGIDTCGSDTPYDDVLIFADPYDITDHYQDGYYIFPLSRFYGMWREGPCAGKEHPYNQPFVVAYPPGKGGR